MADAAVESVEELEQRFAIVSRVERYTALLATALIALLHYLAMAGKLALWRDEVAAVNLAKVSSLSEFWRLCEFDSSFIAWFALLRSWINVFGDSDFSLRILGAGIGLAVLGACWWTVRRFSCPYPLITLSLFALNSAVIYWGDTVRGYGLGTLLMLIMLGETWRFAQRPSWKHLFRAFVPAILAVHTLYYNCIYLFAMCLGVAAVRYRARDWRSILQILGLGFVCALTMLIYVDPVRRVAAWRSVVETPLSIEKVLTLFHGTGVYAAYMLDVVWALLLPLTPVILFILAKRKQGPGNLGVAGEANYLLPVSSARTLHWQASCGVADRALFLLVTFSVGLSGFLILLFWHGYQPQPWHFIPIIGFVSIPIEVALLDAIRYNEAGRKLRLYFVCAFWLLVYYSSQAMVEGRRTNIDEAAERITEGARKGDLIVIQPWFYGISFARYYHGPADYVGVPGIGSEYMNVHRWDRLRDLLKEDDPIAPLMERIDDTLKSGHTVWYLGTYLAIPKDRPIGRSPNPLIPGSPQAKFGSSMHLRYWDKFFIRHFVEHCEYEDLHVQGYNVFGFENSRVVKVTGWHEKEEKRMSE